MSSSNEHHAVRSSKRRNKTDKKSKSKRSNRMKYDSSSRSSSSSVSGSSRQATSAAPRMSIAAYKAQLPPMTPEDKKMNELCKQLGLKGGEYRDGYYVRYVEVPTDKKAPKVVYEDKIVYVDVPEIEYVERTVDDVRVEEVIKHVPRYERVEVPKEVIKYVTKPSKKINVPVPGPIVDVPVPYEVQHNVTKPTFHDQEEEVIVAQVLKPHIHANKGKSQKVEAYTIDPVMYPVDVYVPFPVQSCLKMTSQGETVHNKVDIPDAHYNSLVNKLNETVPDDYRQKLFKTKKGKKGAYIPMLPVNERVPIVNRQRW